MLITHIQRVPDQNASESGAVKEEIAFDLLPVLQVEPLDIAGFRIAMNRVDNALNSGRAAGFGMLAQEGRITGGVELVDT